MQTPKARIGPLEVPQRTSPTKTKSARQLMMTGTETDSASSKPVSRTPKDRSPKVNERKSPRSPAELQKKRPGRMAESESQLAQLQEDLKKMKDQLCLSESCKKHAQQEAEAINKQLITMTAKLEESERQLLEISNSEDGRIQELRKLSQERDRAWESELDALQKQHSADSAALSSALSENQKLRIQLELVNKSEAARNRSAETANTEIQSLKLNLAETLSLAENMKTQLREHKEYKESEAQVQEMVGETLRQLDLANTKVETLQADSLQAEEAYKSVSSELEKSKLQVNALQGLVDKLQADLVTASSSSSGNSPQQIEESDEIMESNQLKEELCSMKLEVEQLRHALETANIRYKDEEIRSTREIQIAYKLVERTNSEAALRESELMAELTKTKADIEALKANLMDKVTELQNISEENEEMSLKVQKSQSGQRESEFEIELQELKTTIADLKANMMDKETELQNLLEENEILKSELEKKEKERGNMIKEAITEADKTKAAEQEALTKLSDVTEEVERNSKRAAWVTEQLEAAQAANSEMEVELRKLKVQSDQWRKAAEAAAAVISTECNGKFDYNYNSVSEKAERLSSPYSDEMDDDLPKKKTMLKKIGVLLKKGQK